VGLRANASHRAFQRQQQSLSTCNFFRSLASSSLIVVAFVSSRLQ
jgi:hypothetical protein